MPTGIVEPSEASTSGGRPSRGSNGLFLQLVAGSWWTFRASASNNFAAGANRNGRVIFAPYPTGMNPNPGILPNPQAGHG